MIAEGHLGAYKDVVPLVGDGCLSRTAKERSFLIFPIVSMMFELTFWPLRKHTKSHVQSSWILSQKKRSLSRPSKTARSKNFE